MATWDRRAIAEAVRRVAATTRGAALHSELQALGWWWGGTRDSIDRAKRFAEQSPHRARIKWLLAELYNLEMAELDRLGSAHPKPAHTGRSARPARVENTHPNGLEGSKRGHPFG